MRDDVFRLVVRNVLAHKMRLAMSALAIVLGVAFLSGVLVFSNGLNQTFNGIIHGTTPDALVRVKGADSFSAGVSGVPAATLSPAVIARLSALPQVARADGNVDGYGMYVVDTHGKLLGGTGAPTLAFNRTDATNMDGRRVLKLTHGRWGRGAGEIVLDEGSAKRAGYVIGDRVRLLAVSGNLERTATLVGTAEFNQGGTAGATLIIFDTTGAQQVFLGGRNAFSTVTLTAAPGVSQAALTKAADKVLPAGFEAVRGDVIVQQSQDAMSSFLTVINTFLLVFALIAVVVGAFIIVNTFSILVAQRMRESALLRALGASRRQVTMSVLAEAMAMAVFASTVGIGLGWALARGLAAMFGAVGLEISGAFLSLSTQAVVISYAVGIVVTLGAALVPALRAGNVPPIAAMRDDAVPPRGSLRRRAIRGTVALVLAAAAAIAGLTGAPGLPGGAWIGVSGFLALLTTAALSPVLGRPVLVGCRVVFGRLFGAPGRLAGENGLRDPRRTGATASALMIGIALVSTIAVMAASLNQSITDLVDQQFSPDFIAKSLTFAPFSTQIGDRMAAVAGVASISREQILQARVDNEQVMIGAVSVGFDTVAKFSAEAGSMTLATGKAVVSADAASRHHWKVGDRLNLGFPAGRAVTITIGGIVKRNVMALDINVPLGVVAQAGISRQDNLVTVVLAPGANAALVKAALSKTVDAIPLVSVLDKAGYAATVRGQVNQLLYMIYGLLALAIVIAIIGIINTLGLSLLERTREIGLLRSIGMTRAQLRRTITLESVAIAALGAILGLVLGLTFGVLLQRVLSDQLTSLALPVTQLALFGAIAILVGVLAAIVPAIRASRLNVLQAISAQ